MLKKTLGLAVGAAILAASAAPAAFAQDQREVQMVGLHQLCDQGDRKACIKFGMMLQQNQDRMNAWRRNHPDWFWWEH